jgi:hypothetical protein
LTSARLVFVHKVLGGSFTSFDMPLALMKDLDFKQPIFGSNYLQLTSKPLYNMIPDLAHVKMWFTEGGCDKFLRIFDVARKQVVTQLRAGRTHHDNTYNQQIQTGHFGGNAYHDPNDPTVVYTHQPKETLQNTQNFMGNNYYNPGGQAQQPQQGQPPQQAPPPQHQGGFQGQGMTLGSNQQPQHPPAPAPNHNYPDAPPPNHDYPDAPPPNQGGNNFYPEGQPHQVNQGYQQAPMGQPYNPQNQQQQPYTVGMNNVPQYNQNAPGVSYYFGVPLGPTVQRNY